MKKWNEIELSAWTQSYTRPVPAFGMPDRGFTRDTPDSGRDDTYTRTRPGGGGRSRGR